jgi:hypothetical protein
MSGFKRTRTDEILSSQSQRTTTTDAVSPKMTIPSSLVGSIEEDYNW